MTWFKWFTTTMKKFGHQQTDHTLFTKNAKDCKKSTLIVYVDNMIIIGDATQEMEDLKKN